MIYLKYFTGTNFGDVLSPFLVRELSGCTIRDKTLMLPSFNDLWRYIFKCLTDRTYYGLKQIEMPWQTVILAVGSILKFSRSNYIVWGSGFMNYNEDCRGGRILAVRGKLSNDRLKVLNYIKDDVVLGDPALLLPLIINAQNCKKWKVGLIPHFHETDVWYKFTNYKIIDLRTTNVHKVVEEITQCEYILSSSLHGLIVAQAYGIPALWVEDGGNKDTDGFKFKDYLTSVGIEPYSPFNINDAIGIGEQNIIELFDANRERARMNKSLELIQRSLLAVAPFPILPKYKTILAQTNSES